MMRPIMGLALACALAGCASSPEVACTLEARSTLVLEVRDARSGQPAAAGARGILRDGAYSDSLVATSDLHLAPRNTWERPGTYRVEVAKEGYAPAALPEVVVRAGECHVETRTVRVDLNPV